MSETTKESYKAWIALKKKVEKMYKPEFDEVAEKLQKQCEYQKALYQKHKSERGDEFLAKKRETFRKCYLKKQERLKLIDNENENQVETIKKRGRPVGSNNFARAFDLEEQVQKGNDLKKQDCDENEDEDTPLIHQTIYC
jgi:23S rRNA pseudoU1915 N3-methylase RlmH